MAELNFELYNNQLIQKLVGAADANLRLIEKMLNVEILNFGNEITIKISSPIYLPQNAVYHDHIKSMVGSDWGVTGIVRTISGNRNLKITIKRGL